MKTWLARSSGDGQKNTPLTSEGYFLSRFGQVLAVHHFHRIVFGIVGGQQEPIRQIRGMKFEILVELSNSWYRSPGELVPYWKLERFSEGDDSRASLRVRVREIKDALGKATGKRLGPDDLIVSVRGRGYILVPPRD